MPFRFTVEKEGFKEVRENLAAIRHRADAEIFEATKDMVERIKDEALEAIPRSHGRERKPERPFATWETIESDTEQRGFAEAEGAVGSSDFIALILEEGSRAHIIEPREAKALHFRVGGQEVFARHVNHPGTPPYRWFSRAWVLSDAYNRQRWHKAARRILFGEEY